MKNQTSSYDVQEKNKTKKSKIIKLIILLVFLFVLFLAYGIVMFKLGRSNKVRLLTHLSLKYHKKFEIIELIDSRQYVRPEVGCDGSTFMPAKEIEGKYEYYYEVLSKSDNVKFNVYLVDDNGNKKFKDSYDICKKIPEINKKLEDYTISKIGNKKTKKDSYYENENYSLNYYCDVNIYLNDEFKNIINTDFINNIEYINNYENEITKDINSGSNASAFFNIKIYDKNKDYIPISGNTNYTEFYVYEKDTHKSIELNNYLEYISNE